MKRLFSSLNTLEVMQLKDVLEKHGIRCFLRNDILAALAPEIPFTESFPELWVENDHDFQQAGQIKDEWLAALQITGESWTCPVCDEKLEPQFTNCWKCGTFR